MKSVEDEEVKVARSVELSFDSTDVTEVNPSRTCATVSPPTVTDFN